MPVKVAKNEERAADDAHRIADQRRRDRAGRAQQDAERAHQEVHGHVESASQLGAEAYARDQERRRQVDELDAEQASRRSGSADG